MSIPGISTSRTVVLLLAIVGGLGLVVQDAPPSKKDADQFAGKIARIQAIAQTPADGARVPARTVLTEAEVNAYLFWNEADVLPIGVTQPRIRLFGDGRMSADAIVDLTAIRNQRERDWLDPLAYVGGRVAVTASGLVRGRDGLATLELSSATIGGVSVPKSVLQELVSYYTRSSASPNGVNLDDPFPLPAAIRDVVVAKGEALVIQ